MHNAAQAANGVNSVFFTQSIWCKHGPGNINHLLCDGLHLLIVRVRSLQRESIAPGRFPGVGTVGISEREDGFRVRFPDARMKEALTQLAQAEESQVVFEPWQSCDVIVQGGRAYP